MHDQNASSDQHDASMPTDGDEPSDSMGDNFASDDANQPQTTDGENQSDDFKHWAQDMQNTPVEMHYDELTDEIAEIVDKLKITTADYLADAYFAPIYQYLKSDELPKDNEKARKILLMSENYYIENDLLYKVSLPRGKKEQRVRPQYYQLCIFENYTASFLNEWHRILGHFAANKLIPTLASRYYWSIILQDIKNVSCTCDICQKSKIITNSRTAPLTPIPIPTRPFALWSMDHKLLTRPTAQENNFFLAFVDHYSRWVKFIPCPDETAFTSAKIFVSEIIANFGRVDYLLSDRGSEYMSLFFATVNKILGVKHKNSAAMAKKTNEMAEQMIKALNQGLKLYSNPDCDDRHLETQIPLIELSLHASANSNTKLSPFFISHGFEMLLPMKSDIAIPDTFHSREWLKESIKTVHDMVRLNRIEAKQEMKEVYDKKHNAKQPDFEIGERVLLKDTRILAGSNKILTKKPYGEKPYIIKQIVASHGAGSAYKLTEERSGKDLRGLITFDRLKHFFVFSRR